MSAYFLIRSLPLRIRPQQHRLAAVLFFGQLRRPAFTTVADESSYPSPFKETEDELKVQKSPLFHFSDSYSASDIEEKEILRDVKRRTLSAKPNLRPGRYMDGERLSAEDEKEIEKEILQDVKRRTRIAKEILRPGRYVDGERLSAEDEKVVMDSFLCYHPNAEDKIGCGLDYIMVDRHPQFRVSRCLFIVRTDGEYTDFSYRKCLRNYIHVKLKSHAEGFIQEYLKL